MIDLITRADDFGSARAANAAILQAADKGYYLKNISCMAAAPCIEEDAGLLEGLRRKKGFCIGLHAVLNSEWKNVHYKSILPVREVPSLVDERGVFAMHPMLFREKMPDVDEAVREISAQLDRLISLGLTVEYLDTHMLPEAAVPGLMDALTEFARGKGLIDQRGFYTFPKQHQPVLTGDKDPEENAREYCEWFRCMEDGKQYINILHPAEYSEETKQFYNAVLTGDSVAKSREAERRILNSGFLEKYCEESGVRTIKYTEACVQGDTTMDAVRNF